jgi:hypothetical protein
MLNRYQMDAEILNSEKAYTEELNPESEGSRAVQ